MVIKCEVHRNTEIESVHQVYGVAVDSNGKILFSSGDPHYITCIRSSLKPFQASVSVETGAADAFGFTDKELAVMCASHNGEKIHTSTISGILGKIDIDSSYYKCGVHSPYDKKTKITIFRDGKDFNSLHNNCSGKHAGMLATAKHLGCDLNEYLQSQHPVQQKIVSALEQYTEQSGFVFGTDGCSAPTPFLSLYGIAILYQKLASGNYPVLSRLYDAMVTHPYLVAGRERFDTDFIEAMSGRAVTKVGGEGVRGLGIRQKNGNVIGIALKVLDGNQRANPVATMLLLGYLKLLTESESQKLEKYEKTKLLNHRKIHVGNITAEFED